MYPRPHCERTQCHRTVYKSSFLRGAALTPRRKKKQKAFVKNSKTGPTCIVAQFPSRVQGVNPAPLNLSLLIAVSSDSWPWPTNFM